MKNNISKNVILLAAVFTAAWLTISQVQGALADFGPKHENGEMSAPFNRIYRVAAMALRSDEKIPALNLTVTRSDDRNISCLIGDCSLREAVNAANASATDDAIDFAPGLTYITLANEIVITDAGTLSITGPGANILTIDGGAGTNRLFSINHAAATIRGLTLTGGNGTGGGISGDGGAIYAELGSLTLYGVHVTGNSTASLGGGVYLSGGAYRVINSTFSANTGSAEGGGIRCGGGSLTIVNSTISGNLSYTGGGIYCDYCTVSLRNATITHNSNSGLAFDHGQVTIGNTIVAGNANLLSPTYVPEINCYGTITSAGGNLVGDSPGDSTSLGPCILAYQQTDIRDTYPQMGPLQNNGGSTPTHALLGASPAIDKGLNALAVDPENDHPLSFDQRGTGFPRLRDGNGDGTATVDIGAFEGTAVSVTNLEELYAAVNNPQNAGMNIIVAPGVYLLSANDPNGAARPNGGRLDLQQDMSLQGVIGDRTAVVIDAINLPVSSFNNAPPINVTGAIRMGRGANAVEWLTVRNAANGASNVETELVGNGTAHIRIAHIATSGSQRGIDVRNFGPTQAGRVIVAEIVDNDLFDNIIGAQGEALRIVNNGGADGGSITATLSDNRSYHNYLGLIIDNNGSSLANISVTSTGDKFFENGLGALVGAGLSGVAPLANGNTVSFTAIGSTFESNNGFNNFDFGGLLIVAAENTLIPDGASNNTVNVELRNCRIANNQVHDLVAIGARSNPESIGTPGTNNHVNLTLRGIVRRFMVEEFTNCIPDFPGGMNTVTISRLKF